MAKIRVYELARDLNLTNKELLGKLKEMNIDVKNHMGSLDDDSVAAIKAFLFQKPSDKKVDEKRVKPTVIRRRKKTVETEVDTETKAVDETVSEEEPPQKETAEEAAPPDKAAEEVLETKKEAPPPVETEQEVEGLKETPVIAKPEAEVEKKKEKKEKKKSKKHVAAKIIKLPEVPEEPLSVEGAIQDKTDTGLPIKDQMEIKTPPEPAKEEKKKEKKKRKEDDSEKDTKFFKKKISFKRKAVVEGTDLYDEGRTRVRKGRKGAKVKAAVGQKTQITTPKAIKRRIKIDDTIALSDLAKRMGIKANEMIQKLMKLGVMATVNQTIDYDTAVLVASEFEYEVEKATFEEEGILSVEHDDPDKMVARPPVVTIMGHVDHGKTSLLDVIRKTKVTESEAGGITQHIGAYDVTTDNGRIVFLDTPGHEAFTSMRARGAQITDIVILVVAADDGVMPQTIEAINHAKAAGVPIIVAINKIDKENAEPERVKRELSEHGVLSEEWGGDTIFAAISAKQKIGIDNLLDMILLQAEVMELKANPDKRARGHVVESRLDSGRGTVATVLIQEGTLYTGETVVCGMYYGKVRALLNNKGVPIKEAGPSIPVEILGLNGVPEAGDELISVENEKSAKQVSDNRIQKQRAKELAKSSRLSLEKLFEKMEQGEVKDLNLIVKADVHGSIEALVESLTKLSSDEVKIHIIHAATGTITESDVSLAAVSNAIIIGFNVRPGSKAHELAAEENVDMRFYDVIYNVTKDIKDAMLGMMSSTFKEQFLGRAEVREVFVIPKQGSIAGSYVLDGKIERNRPARLVRDGIVIYDGKIGSLKRFKDDAKEVLSGYECGIGIENFNDIKVGDTIECYQMEEIKPVFE